METDSLIIKKVLDEIWDIPWSISVDIQCIKLWMEQAEVEVVHTFREGNRLADYLANHIVHFSCTNVNQFNNIQNLPQLARKIFTTKQRKIPNIRIKKMQNKGFNTQIRN